MPRRTPRPTLFPYTTLFRSDAETRDFATLAERLNRMTDHLLDAQGQLVRSEKLASIGRLAAGIAHEVGNPLGAIGTYVEVLRRRGRSEERRVGKEWRSRGSPYH